MSKKLKLLAVISAIALVSAACATGGGGDGGEATGGEVTEGGTLELALLSDVSAAFDPQKEYYTVTWGLYRCCLLRTLLSYNGLSAEDGGDELQPDLAEDLPEVNEDATQWTFTLKQGINFGPPFEDEEITSANIVEALEREADPEAAANGYSFYYSIIEGFDDVTEGKADTISGIETPDDYTITFNLTEPTGDFGYRMAMPATAPIPIGAADGHDPDYGRFLVASGPYMFEGSEDLDFDAPPKQQQPVSGYKPGRSITLVRNPSWDQSTDDLRPAYVDGINVTIGGTEEDLANQVDAGEIDLVYDGVAPPQQVRTYSTDPELRDQIHSEQSDAVRYLSMNIAEPPFDDIAVREAVNLALDKEGMRRIRGGPLFGDIAGHIIVPSLLSPETADIDPYATPGDTGDPEAAKEAMSQSKYDTDGDGVCDDPVCKDILSFTDEADPYPDQAALISDNFAEIGLTLDIKSFERTTMYDKCNDPTTHGGLCLGPGWGKDYPDAYTFAPPLFSDASIGPDSCCNYSLVGASAQTLRENDYEVSSVPGVDPKLDECQPLQGDERIQCWAELDEQLMTEVIPWIPYLFDKRVDVTSSRITNYTFDQFNGGMSLDHVGIAESEQ